MLLPALFLFSFHISQVGGAQRFNTAEIMTSHSGKKVAAIERIGDGVEKKLTAPKSHTGKMAKFFIQSPYFKLFSDYSSVKRHGFGNLKLDMLAGALMGLFLILLMLGLVRERSSYIVLGLWGLLTCVQASTGLLQFSSYQREGWSLLIATCCLSGVVASWVYRFGEQSLFFRICILTVMAASTVWCVIHPPFHFPLRSSGEDDLVRTIRYLGKASEPSMEKCQDAQNSIAVCSITELLDDDLDFTLVTRRYVGWGNQGEIALNVIPFDSMLSVLIVDNKMKRDIFQPGSQYVALIDEHSRLSGQQMISAFAMVTPSLVGATMKSRERMFRLNEIIIRQIESLPESVWKVTRVQISEKLSAYVVAPLDKASN